MSDNSLQKSFPRYYHPMKERVIPPHLITPEDLERAKKKKKQDTEKAIYGRQ
jgi:hypothetical protein